MHQYVKTLPVVYVQLSSTQWHHCMTVCQPDDVRVHVQHEFKGKHK